MKPFDYSTYELVRRRAAYPLLQRFGINRYELWMLCQMAGCCRHLNKAIVSKNTFFGNITGNSREKAKMQGYYTGLVNKKFVSLYEYKAKPGSESFKINALGARVLNEYHKEIEKMAEKLAADARCSIDPYDWINRDQPGTYFQKSA